MAAGAGLLALAGAPARADTRAELWPLLVLSQGYTDNLLLTANAKSDEVSTLIGGASLALANPRRRFELDYLTDGQLYAEHPGYDRLAKDNYAGLRDFEDLTNTTQLWLADTFIDGQSIFGQALIGADGLNPQLAEALLQRNYQTNSFDAHLHHDFEGAFSTDSDLHQALYVTSGGTSTLSTNQGAYLTAYYRMSERLRAGVGYDFEDFRFSSQPRSDSHEPYLSLLSDLGPRMRLAAQAGPLILDSRSAVSMDVGYSVTASYLAEYWGLNLSSSRAPAITAGFAGAGIGQSAGGAGHYRLTRRATLYAWAGYTGLSGGGTSARIMSCAIGVNHRLDRRFSLFLQYLWFRTTTPTSPAALTNAVAAGVKLDARPWRWSW